MTWSIIARDPATGHVGIAVATRFFAVGARVPHIQTGVGAVATQAMSNPYYGPRGLRLLEAGAPAADVVRLLTTADEGRDHRQLHVMDAQDRSAAWTGTSCVPWCGHLVRPGFSVAGNMLAGPKVIEDTAGFYEDNPALPFPRRLIAALKAGEAAGGDKRGKQAAALLIHDGEEFAALDIRVDDHVDPLAELERLEQVSRERWTHFRKFGPSRANPAGILDREKLDALIAQSIADEAGQ
jgi:uncharacterized Ntn-hydrolase superfamily protein